MTYRFSILAEVFTTDAPKVISIGACGQRCIGSFTWGTLYDFLCYCMGLFPLEPHLL